MRPGRPEEEAEQRAERRASDGARAGAPALGAGRRRHQVDGVARGADEADDDEREGTDAREPVGPGAEQQPGEDERRAGDGGQHHAREAHCDQQAREQPE